MQFSLWWNWEHNYYETYLATLQLLIWKEKKEIMHTNHRSEETLKIRLGKTSKILWTNSKSTTKIVALEFIKIVFKMNPENP